MRTNWFEAHTPAQPQIQLSPCVYPQGDENRGQCWSSIYHPQTGELERIGRHLNDLLSALVKNRENHIARLLRVSASHIPKELAGLRCSNPCSVCQARTGGPPAVCILTPAGPNRARYPFHSLCGRIVRFFFIHVDLPKVIPILHIIRHIRHLVMEVSCRPLQRVRHLPILLQFLLFLLNPLTRKSYCVERWTCFRHLRRCLSFLHCPKYRIGGCQCGEQWMCKSR